MKSFGLTDKGTVRKDNQDSFIIEKCNAGDCTIIALCDGMGGAKAGGLASRLSNKAFVAFVYEKLSTKSKKKTDYSQVLRDACSNANGVAYEYSHFDEEYEGMGTTIVGGIVKKNGKAYIINVGDSRAYLISVRRETIVQITKDHSLVGILVESGAITKEQAKVHPKKNVIIKALGSEKTVEPDSYEIEIGTDDILLMCSDGLTNTLSEEEILEAAVEIRDVEKLCRLLMSKALNKGARDNVTVLVVAK